MGRTALTFALAIAALLALSGTASAATIISARLVLVSAKIGGGSGFDPRHDTISHNTITGNSPLDVFYDGSGSDNHFRGNTCNASQPSWISTELKRLGHRGSPVPQPQRS